MKRALAMGLGTLMVAGAAAPASAASHIDFSGYYRIQYMSETNTGFGRESRSFTDSYFKDRLNIDLTFSPTDEISVYWRLRGPNYQRWGRYDTGDKNLFTQFIYGEIRQDWGTVTIGRMSDDLDCAGLCTFGYMPATIPIFTNNGVFDRADIMDGVRYSHNWDNGLSFLVQYVKLGNNDVASGQTYNWASDQDYDRFQMQVAYAWDGGGASLHGFYDRNAQPAEYSVWAPGDVWGGNEGHNSRYHGFAVDSMGWLASGSYYNIGTANEHGLDGLRINKVEQWGLNPSVMHSWGDFSVHFEGMAQWGQAQLQYTEKYTSGDDVRRTTDIDGKGYGAYLDFDYNYGPGNVTLGAWWVSGTDLDEMYNRDGTFNRDAESKSIANLVGGNFYPLLVAYNGVNGNLGGGNRHFGNAGSKVSGIGFANNAYENYVWEGHVGGYNASSQYLALGTTIDIAGANNELNRDVLTAGNINRTRTVSFNNGTDANHWAIALTGNHAFTDDISMHYGLAYLGLNKANYRIVNSASYTDNGVDPASYGGFGYSSQDKDLGFEVDLGFTFQLLDNLSFTTAFGYMFNGDAYKQFKGYKLINGTNPGNDVNALDDGDRIRGVWEDADDSYVWFNTLTFAF